MGFPASPLVTAKKAGTTNGVTTDAIDTTGVTLLVANVGWYGGVDGTVEGTFSDSKSNSWNPLTKRTSTSTPYTSNQLFWCIPTTVGSGHTVSYNGTSIFPSIEVQGWSGQTASPFDQQSGTGSGTAATIAPGSVTPSEDNELVIAGLGHENNSAGAVSIDGGFTADAVAYVGGAAEGSAMAYLVQTSATAANPTWNITNAAPLAATIATFKAAPANAPGVGALVFSGPIAQLRYQINMPDEA